MMSEWYRNRKVLVQCLAAAAVTWLPLFVLTLLAGQATGSADGRSLMTDLSTEARYLLALPLFIVAGVFARPRLKSALDYLSESDMLIGSDRDEFEAATSSFNRWVDARGAVIGLWVLAFISSALTLAALVHDGGVSWFSDGSRQYAGVSPAGWWHVIVGLTLWHFIVLRRILEFVAWWVFLTRLARLDLQLVPTHPDRCGGIGILEMGQLSFSLLGAGAALILSASLAESLIAQSMKGPSAIPYIAIFVLICLVVVLVPLLGFVPILIRAKRSGLVQYGDLGESLFRAFGTKWTGKSNAKQVEMLGGTDPSSLADYGYAYEVVAAMRSVILSRQGFMTIAMAAVIPFLPLVFVDHSITEILERLLGIGG